MPKPNLSRRNLLKVAGAAAAAAVVGPYIVPASARGAERIPSPSNRVTMGWIGVGGRGGALLSNFLGIPDAQVLALCDVKKANRDRAQAAVNKQYDNQSATTFVDFRELLARQDIDSVVVASTDHWHVPLALAAVRAGKDVYCEKPLGVSVEQDIALRNAVQRYGRVFQFGTQERSSWSTRQACEIVQNGWIGKVHTIKVGTRYSRTSDNYPAKPAPAEIDYDMWLGPAPVAPYCDERVSNSHWFHISDYSLGFIAGCGIHTIDMATWGNGTDLTGPLEVEGTGEFPRDGLCDNATAWNVNLKFANGVLMNFTDGQKNPLGVRFEGPDGWVFVLERHLGGTYDAEPKSLMKRPLEPSDIHLPVSNHHQENFIECCKSRARTVAPIEVAVRSDTLCQLSDIAMRLGRKIKWDPEKEIIVNDAEASRMLTRPMRSPWRL